MEIWIEGREEKFAVFKSLLEAKLEKSTILLLLSVFVVYHHCLRRRIIQRNLLQNGRDNLCHSSLVRGTKTGFPKLSLKPKEKHSPLLDSRLMVKGWESFENDRVSGLPCT